MLLGVALYGGPTAGAVVGWRLWSGFLGAAIGLTLGVGIGVAIMAPFGLLWLAVARGSAARKEPKRP